jgi:phage tail protein X
LFHSCQIDDKRLALWWCDKYYLRVSGVVAAVLVDEKLATWADFSPHRE